MFQEKLKKLALSMNVGLFRTARNGFVLLIPVFILGSIAVLMNNIPIDSYQEMMTSQFGDNWKNFGIIVYNYTFGFISLYVAASLSYTISYEYFRNRTIAFIVSIVAIINLLIDIEIANSTFVLNELGTIHLFSALISSYLTYYLFRIFYWFFKKFSRRSFIFHDPLIEDSLLCVLPTIFTVLTFLFGMYYIQVTYRIAFSTSLQDSLRTLYHSTGGSFVAIIYHTLLNQLSWSIGIHGSNLLHSYAVPIMEQTLELQKSSGVSFSLLFTKPFIDTFIHMGGSGATISLVIAMFMTNKKTRTNRLARIALIPSLFNINEILIFGIPIVLNPVLIIPFILVPLVTSLVSIFFIGLGIVPVPINDIAWTTPILFSGYLTTGSFGGTLLQIFNLIIGVVIYTPFVKIYVDFEKDQNIKLLSEMTERFTTDEFNDLSSIIEHSTSLEMFMKQLGRSIKFSLEDNSIYMNYQPLVDSSGKVEGLEALVRWNHPDYGFIAPPVLINTAEYTNQINELGKQIIDMSFRGFRSIKDELKQDIYVSVNLSPTQIQSKDIIETLETYRKRYLLNPTEIVLEVTESMQIVNEKVFIDIITILKDLGYRLAIDDFGMGYTSLVILKKTKASIIKLDGSLTKDVHIDQVNQKIIHSISNLSDELELTIVAEFIEHQEQIDMLDQFNCSTYQGYLFSKALSVEDIIEKYKSKQKED
jgi:lactose/cellobiose-specific phosphotransferase system IIC component